MFTGHHGVNCKQDLCSQRGGQERHGDSQQDQVGDYEGKFVTDGSIATQQTAASGHRLGTDTLDLLRTIPHCKIYKHRATKKICDIVVFVLW